MYLWILVYSPATNLDLIKLAYFSCSSDLESFVLNNKLSVKVHFYECLNFKITFEGVK